MSLRTAAALLLVARSAAAQLPAVGNVHAEDLPADLRINGLAVEVTHLRGPGVQTLVAATARQWAASPQTQGPWQQVSRQSRTASEVLQWRSAADGLEALYSRLPLRQAPRTTSRLALQLPAPCRPVSHLDLGTAKQPAVQVTARCEGSSMAVQGLLAEAASRSGWHSIAVGGVPHQWSRPGQTLQLDLIETPSGLALVAVQVGREVSR